MLLQDKMLIRNKKREKKKDKRYATMCAQAMCCCVVVNMHVLLEVNIAACLLEKQ